MRSRGYTLVEMLLVLGLLTVLAGLAWPAVLRMTSDQPLLEGAEQIRQFLAQSRELAVETGLPVTVQAAIGEGSVVRYSAEQLPGPNTTTGNDGTISNGPPGTAGLALPGLKTSTGSPVGTGGTASTGSNTATESSEATTFSPIAVKTLTLPKGLEFMAPGPPLEPMPERVQSNLTGGLTNANWSAGIVFQPDGSAVNEVWSLVSQRGRQIRISVRGLTGGVRISPLEAAEQEATR